MPGKVSAGRGRFPYRQQESRFTSSVPIHPGQQYDKRNLAETSKRAVTTICVVSKRPTTDIVYIRACSSAPAGSNSKIGEAEKINFPSLSPLHKTQNGILSYP